MTGSMRAGQEVPLMWSRCSTEERGTSCTRSQELVLSCPWEPRLTVALLVSLSLWTVVGDESTFATLKISEIGWLQELSLFEKL